MTKTSITFLQAAGDIPLTKTFKARRKGQYELVRSYPHVAKFTSHTISVGSISAFGAELERHAELGMCLLKGEIQRDLDNESRARSTDSSTPTKLLCLDIDGSNVETIDDFLALLPAPFQQTSYVYQYSASHGMGKKGLRAHVFYLLRTAVQPNVLKNYLRWLNLNVPALKKQIALSQSKSVCTFSLDITVAQNDKLIYIAPPVVLKGGDPVHKRFGYVKRKSPSLALKFDKVNPERDKAALVTVFNELRKAEGLPIRRHLDTKTTKSGIAVLKNPGEVQISEMREERGFVYFNLNGGDSWGYYHPIGNAEIMYNFKGEPNYLIKEIAPEYYASITANAVATGSVHDEQAGVHYFGFLDPRTDTYWRGQYDEVADILEAHKANNMTKVQHFLKSHGQHVGDFIPEWRATYEFDSDVLFDPESRRINLYVRSPYLRTSKTRTSPPARIKRLIHHVMGGEEEFIEHFHNWFGVIFLLRRRTGTAQVWWGTQGTGKGVLFHDVMTPMIGRDYVSMVAGLSAFEKEFNGFVESSLLCLCNEVQLSELNRKSTAMAAIKQIITDSSISIRRMRTDSYSAHNYCNLIFASNKFDPVQVDRDDRRFTVAPRQESRLLDIMTREEIRSIGTELEDYAAYLKSRKLDEDAAATPLESEHSEHLKTLSQDAATQVSFAIRNGDLDFIWEYKPENEDPSLVLQRFPHSDLPRYDDVLYEYFQNIGSMMHIPRSHLELLFYYICGTVCNTAHKFTQFCHHKELRIVPIRYGNKITRGVQNVMWSASAEVRQEMTKYFAQQKRKRKKV